MSFVAGFGLTNIDLLYAGIPYLPQEGEEVYGTDFSLQLGGGFPATLVNLGRLQVPSKICTLLGDDLFSAFAKQAFEQSGAAPCNVYSGSGMPLNVTTAVLTPHDRTFISYNGGFCITQAMKETFYQMAHGAKIAYIHPDFFDVCQKLKAEGTQLIFDMGWEDDLSLQKYAHILELADYYTPNSKEAMKMTETSSPEDALHVLSKWFRYPIVKVDKDGCLVLSDGKMKRIRSMPDIVQVDATGAGDAFLSGFTYGLFHERPIEDCVLFGNITGGTCVTGIGCLSAYVNEEQLLSLFEKLYPLCISA